MDCISYSIKNTQGYKRLIENIDQNQKVGGVTKQAVPHLLSCIQQDTGRGVFYITPSDYAAKTLHSKHAGSLYLPEVELELGQADVRSSDISAMRVGAISNIIKQTGVVYMSAEAFCYKMRPKSSFGFIDLRVGQTIPPRELMESFVKVGYERTMLIEGVGQCSGRGEIIECFCPSMRSPVRISFFDDEIESIRYFDQTTQRSYGENLENVQIAPALEMLLTQEEKADLVQYLKSNPKGESNLARLELSGTFANIEAFSSVLKSSVSILSYAQNPIVVLEDKASLNREWEEKMQSKTVLFQSMFESGYVLGCENDCFFDLSDILEDVNTTQLTGENFGIYSATGFNADIPSIAKTVSDRKGYKIYLFAGARASMLSKELMDLDIVAPVTRGEALDAPGVVVVNKSLENGFEVKENKTYILGETDIFGYRKREKKAPKKKMEAQEFFADLDIGDIVVHDINGKGRYKGLKKITSANGVQTEYMEIEYRDGDRLYVQISQLDRVQKYIGPADENTVLSKLGGKEWEKTKARARASVKKMAEDLVQIYQERESKKGYRFSADTVWQNEFEAAFEYEETSGQIEAITQIKHDMESDAIMDRLLLGDVGYGKTEVAMRACFKAVMDSKQVAVLAPTTLLARQHTITFKERFAGYPVRIECLSRFSKSKETLDSLKQGKIDIIIGTHQLLSKKTEFHNLGLLVVDEEQRFGVSHKERIKNIKRNIDVLTLTATPIPRTLEMAMTGIRQMSTIDTPPALRKEVAAYVVEHSEAIVKEALLKEKARGGQAYFVVSKISQIEDIQKQIAKIEGLRVGVAHGQMDKDEFERVINAFYEHEFDVLICTTIIESGIDIPAANTIIIYEADKFGLAQLYQLKGRVGRSTLRAYAYFTYKRDNMSEIAQKRLEAIREFTQFGSGFKIAMRDLQIRGAGNILGAEQSGHMANVGYAMYCEMVRAQVALIRGEVIPEKTECTVDMGINALIPAGYISDEKQKLEMYRHIASIQGVSEYSELISELTERYGAVPKEVENLILISLVKCFAQKAGLVNVCIKNKKIELRFAAGAKLHMGELANILAGYNKTALYRPSSPPALIFTYKKNMFMELLDFLGHLKRCIVY